MRPAAAAVAVEPPRAPARVIWICPRAIFLSGILRDVWFDAGSEGAGHRSEPAAPPPTAPPPPSLHLRPDPARPLARAWHKERAVPGRALSISRRESVS